jgi:hypothetical protein
MMCGSAFKNKGVQTLLDAVVDFLPSPVDRGAMSGMDVKTGEAVERKPLDSEPLSLLAFKIMDDPYGVLTFARIYSGKLESGMNVINTSRDKRERVGRILLMHANNREEIKEAYAGDIVALLGLKDTRTGETLSDPNNRVILEKMEFPEPVIEMKVEPKSKATRKRWASRCQDGDRGPLVPGQHRPRERRDHHQGHGRAASRDQGRHSASHAQRRGRDRRAAGCLPRDLARATGHRLHAQEAVRWFGPVRPRQAASRAAGAGHGQRLRVRDRRRHGAEGIHPRRREGRREHLVAAACSSASRWSIPR